MIRAQQSHGAQDTQKSESGISCNRKQGRDDDDIRNGRELKQKTHAIFADHATQQEVDCQQDCKCYVDDDGETGDLEKRKNDEGDDGDGIKHQNPAPEPHRSRTRPIVEFPDSANQCLGRGQGGFLNIKDVDVELSTREPMKLHWNSSVPWLLDNTIIDELRKGPECRREVSDWYASVPEADIWLSVLVIGHMCKSLEALRKKDRHRVEAAMKGIKDLGDQFHGRILPVTKKVAAEWGHITSGTTLPTVLGLHAATARAHGMSLATIDPRSGEIKGVHVVDPIHELSSLMSVDEDTIPESALSPVVANT